MAGKIDYSVLAIPKVKPQGPSWKKQQGSIPAARPREDRPKPGGRKPKGPTAKARAKKRTATMAVAATDRQRVFERQQHTCFAVGVSKVCRRRVQDPHELVPVGAGGKRVSRNRVGLCRPCHDAAQGKVGGNVLIFDWVGKADGQPPNADQLGNVTVKWIG